MADRLTPLDVSFLYLEESTTPMHVGSVAVFRPPAAGLEYDRFVALVSRRLALSPRYRQKVRRVPFNLAYPVWVDDPEFDVDYHVRRSALPRPGSAVQLRELVARLMSRRLDQSRPLWEMYLVEGLADDRVAVVTKIHQALVEGVHSVDLWQAILDDTPEGDDGPDGDDTPEGDTAPPTTGAPWASRRSPHPAELVVDAVADVVRRPSAVLDALRVSSMDARAALHTVAGAATGLFAAALTASRPAPDSPLNAVIGEQRRFATVSTELAAYRTVRATHGGTVNDVVLATVTGALRQWLLTRGSRVTGHSVVRALVPVSVRSATGGRVTAYLIDLPVGEPNPVVRLHQVSFAMRAHQETGQSMGADALVALSGFASPTLHALGARAASGLSRRLFNLVVTNAPGPQRPLYAAGAQMLEVFPVLPLARGQAVSLGLTSYDGRVHYGLLADRDAMPDIDVLAELVTESLAELVETVR